MSRTNIYFSTGRLTPQTKHFSFLDRCTPHKLLSVYVQSGCTPSPNDISSRFHHSRSDVRVSYAVTMLSWMWCWCGVHDSHPSSPIFLCHLLPSLIEHSAPVVHHLRLPATVRQMATDLSFIPTRLSALSGITFKTNQALFPSIHSSQLVLTCPSSTKLVAHNTIHILLVYLHFHLRLPHSSTTSLPLLWRSRHYPRPRILLPSLRRRILCAHHPRTHLLCRAGCLWIARMCPPCGDLLLGMWCSGTTWCGTVRYRL